MRHRLRLTRLFVEQLTVIDCGLLDVSRGLAGVSWLVDAEIAGALDDGGMILDFGPAKRLLKQRIDAFADHRVLVPADAPGLELSLGEHGSRITFSTRDGQRIHHRAPRAAVCVLPGTAIHRDELARRLEAELATSLPANVTGLHLTLREEVIDGAHYNYCHGLRKHGGQCQHIGHGHRSRLEILVNGCRSHEHEQAWCRRWQDIFLGSRTDLVQCAHEDRYRFAYQSAAGYFELELDAARCELLDGDSTVENIAAFIADTLKAEQPNLQFTVRAYEGAYKGAVVTR